MNRSLVQGTEEWKALRQTKLGGSDSPIVMGVSKYLTPFQLWEIKLGLRQVETNSAMRRGSEMEDEARREFERIHNVSVFPDVVFHPEYDFLMASLDGISIDRSVIVEIKCVNRHDHQTALNGRVPDHYFPQLQHQLAVTGLPYMYYFSYDQLTPATVIVQRDDVYIANMIKKEKEFYRCMTEFEAPPLTEKDYIEHSDLEWEFYAQEYLSVQQQRKYYENKEENCKRELVKLSEGKNSKGCGIRMTRFIRKGNIQYDKVEALQGIT